MLKEILVLFIEKRDLSVILYINLINLEGYSGHAAKDYKRKRFSTSVSQLHNTSRKQAI